MAAIEGRCCARIATPRRLDLHAFGSFSRSMTTRLTRLSRNGRKSMSRKKALKLAADIPNMAGLESSSKWKMALLVGPEFRHSIASLLYSNYDTK